MHSRLQPQILMALLACLALPLAAMPNAAWAESDAGTASTYPWSGFWWPHAEGSLTGPLSKYDQAFSTQAANWDAQQHPAANAGSWFGHCHAWSAASVTEKEPEKPREHKGITYTVGDQKGLLCALHAQDEAHSYGQRNNSDGIQADLLPDELWRVCQMYIKQKNVPIIMDLSADSEVWNYPVFDYEVTHQDAGNGWHNGTITLTFAEDDVHPDYVGTEANAYTYTFRAQFQGGSIVAGTSEWTGQSVTDHPDFAWYPYVARAENPYVDADKVSQIVGFGVGGSNNPPTEDDDAGLTDDIDPDNNEHNVVIDEGVDYEPPPRDVDESTPAQRVDVNSILSPLEMVATLANQTSHFKLDIFVDKNDGGKYAAGEPIRISAESEKEGFLYLFDIQPDGNLTLIFPRYGEPNYMEAGVLYDVPGQDETPWFTASEHGEHHLRGIVLTSPIAITGFQTQATKGKFGKFNGKKPKGKDEHFRGFTAQHLRVPPPKQQIVQTSLKQYYTKSLEQKPPKKLKHFAQDDCLYFVIDKGGKQQQNDVGPQQQNGQSQQQSDKTQSAPK